MAETLYKIQLRNVPERFDIDLAGTTYIMESRWNDYAGYWTLDIYDADSAPLVMSIPMVTGVDLTAQFPGFPGFLTILTDGDDYAAPTLDSLGVESNLYFGSFALLAELDLGGGVRVIDTIVTVRGVPVFVDGQIVRVIA